MSLRYRFNREIEWYAAVTDLAGDSINSTNAGAVTDLAGNRTGMTGVGLKPSATDTGKPACFDGNTIIDVAGNRINMRGIELNPNATASGQPVSTDGGMVTTHVTMINTRMTGIFGSGPKPKITASGQLASTDGDSEIDRVGNHISIHRIGLYPMQLPLANPQVLIAVL